MRLIKINGGHDISLVEFIGNDQVPPYAILSHFWGKDADEVTYQDLQLGNWSQKAGLEKIVFCENQARKDGLEYFWIDTACIDKTNNAELSEAINSMFQWYQNASKCYVYLADIFLDQTALEYASNSLACSRWFRRGWTLQELLAPSSVEFFDSNGIFLGDKASLEETLHEITRIPFEALRNGPLSIYSVDERIRWAENRETRREEDAAYSLLGIFDVTLVTVYGEGKRKAMARLRREIQDTNALADIPQPTGLDLYNAVREDDLERVTALIKRGVSVDYTLQTARYDTILHLAVRCGSGRCLDAVLDAGPMLSAYNGQGVTPLMLAAILGNTRAAQKLIDQGCSLESKMQAMRHVAESEFDLENELTSESTALILAAQNGQLNVMAVLLTSGANVESRTNHGMTALHAACVNGHTRCAKLLIESGADVDARASVTRTPLWICAHYGWLALASTLLEAGADVEAPKRPGMTPLLEAAWRGQWKIAELLISNGANMAARSGFGGLYSGMTALHVAINNENKMMVETLVRGGCAMSVCNDAGEIPEQFASSSGKHRMLKILQDALRQRMVAKHGAGNQADRSTSKGYYTQLDPAAIYHTE